MSQTFFWVEYDKVNTFYYWLLSPNVSIPFEQKAIWSFFNGKVRWNFFGFKIIRSCIFRILLRFYVGGWVSVTKNWIIRRFSSVSLNFDDQMLILMCYQAGSHCVIYLVPRNFSVFSKSDKIKYKNLEICN